ncbi:MAG: hypothetical protein KGI08_09125, partial [Thaumarchaeota archaeon]|nr:hypothetical protein [Nitrososphaerota archaeon]
QKLNAFDQLAVARKLSPALPLMKAVVDKDNSGKPKDVLIIMALGMLSDENSTFIVNKCLSVVTVSNNDGSIAKLMINGNLMFDSVTLSDITEITAAVIEDNLGDFLNTALQGMPTI